MVCGFRIHQDGVQTQTASIGEQFSALGVIVQTFVHFPGLTAVMRFEERTQYESGIQHAGLSLPAGCDVPDLENFLRCDLGGIFITRIVWSAERTAGTRGS